MYTNVCVQCSITCDIGRLTRKKCHPPMKEHRSILVDPLKFVVDLPAHRGVVYVAVVSQDQDGKFELHDVYQQQKKQLRTTFDIVQPQRYIMLPYFKLVGCHS